MAMVLVPGNAVQRSSASSPQCTRMRMPWTRTSFSRPGWRPPLQGAPAAAALLLAGARRHRAAARGGRRARWGPEDPGDALIPQQPLGRIVSKGDIAALEYDPADAPEFIADEHGEGEFSWEPLTPEGALPGEEEQYLEQVFQVPVDRLDYLMGAGWLEAGQDEALQDYRAYVDDEVIVAHGREWKRVVLRGERESVDAGGLRLMAGVLRQRPWDEPSGALRPSPAAAVAGLPAGVA